MSRLRRLLLTNLVLAILVIVGILTFGNQRSEAVTGSQWRAGNIIADSVFFNKNAMSVSQIQTFLNAKVPVCAKNHSAYSPTYPPPYTCLKDYQENTTTGESNVGRYNGDGSPYQVPGGKSAAQIIWDAAQAYNINPQTLIVMLQKEQSLVTDDWPLIVQYQKAMGQSCPDTAPCDPAFAGFYRQVSGAAWQLRHYINNPQYFNYRAGVTRFVLYNPNTSCGGTNVFIENHATAALYNYTPYQPNAGALSNLYGTAPCGAYGNRNFWRLFNDWFGSTTGQDYAWQYHDISISTGSSNVMGNTDVSITVVARNIGNQSWSNTNFPIRLATWDPTSHDSALYHPTWTNRTRPATLNESVVLPGELGTFTFTAKIPNRDGNYLERFNLVAEGSTWMPDAGFTLHLVITKSTYKWTMVSQSSDKNFVLNPGTSSQFTLVAKNTGNTTWTNTTYPVRLATFVPTGRSSVFADPSWISAARPATLQEASVAPGQNGTFVFTVKAPTAPGFYIERFNLVMEGVSWFEDPWMEYQIRVGNFYTWQMVSQTSSTGSFVMGRNTTATFTLIAKNTGNVTWNNSSSPVRLATWNPSYRNSVFNDGSWTSQFRAATLVESSVAPGQNGTFVFSVRAPGTPGFYVERFNLVMEGQSWFTDPWMEFNILVN